MTKRIHAFEGFKMLPYIKVKKETHHNYVSTDTKTNRTQEIQTTKQRDTVLHTPGQHYFTLQAW